MMSKSLFLSALLLPAAAGFSARLQPRPSLRRAGAPSLAPLRVPVAERGFVALRATSGKGGEESRLPWFIDPGTYGGVLVLTVAGLVIPFSIYGALIASGMDEASTGVAMSGILVVGSIVLWTLTYIFRVFTKQMTYTTQLKNYEDAVIAKRFEELDEDEVAALMEEIEREEKLGAAPAKDKF